MLLQHLYWFLLPSSLCLPWLSKRMSVCWWIICIVCVLLIGCCWISGIGDLLPGECERKLSSSVCQLQKSRWAKLLLSAAFAAERFLRYICCTFSTLSPSTFKYINITVWIWFASQGFSCIHENQPFIAFNYNYGCVDGTTSPMVLCHLLNSSLLSHFTGWRQFLSLRLYSCQHGELLYTMHFTYGM